MLIVVTISLVACVSVTEKVTPYVDYIEDGLATATVDGYAVEWIVGASEGERFGQIRLYPLNDEGIKKNVSLTAEGVTYEMKKSDKRYALECKTASGSIPEVATLTIDGAELIIEPIVSNEPISAEKALETAIEHFSSDLKGVLNETSPSLTGKVKIVVDRLGKLPYYYYVSFRSDKIKLACMIDPGSGMVVASEKR